MHLIDNIAHILKQQPELVGTLSPDPTLAELNNLAEKSGYALEHLIQFNLSAEELMWSNIRIVLLDVDGVLTEGGMFYTERGDEFKRFDTKDGMAIKEAMKQGIEFGIISSGINKNIIQHRADMFGIKHVYVGTEPKLKIAEKWLDELGFNWIEVAYIGDDINDLEMIAKSGVSACPADAASRVKSEVSFVLKSKGGHGCVREFMAYFPQLKHTI